MNNKLITLVTVIEEERNNNGFKTGEQTYEVEIFADEKSVGRTEQYEALRSGIEVNIIFCVAPDDFSLSKQEIIKKDGSTRKINASRIRHEENEYLIVRTFKNKQGMLEITCREVE